MKKAITEPQQKKKRRADTGPRLIDRDFDAFQWIGEQYCISLDHLSILLARSIDPEEYAQKPKAAGQLTEKRTSAIIKRWQELGLVEKRWIIHGDPPIIWLSGDGLRLVAEDIGELRHYEPSPGKLNHFYYCNEIRLNIEAKRQGAEWISERLIRNRQMIPTGKHTPDAILHTNGKTVAIEVELSTKAYTRLDKILHELALNADYHTVWYFCKGKSALNIIKNAKERMHEMYREKIVIYDIDKL